MRDNISWRWCLTTKAECEIIVWWWKIFDGGILSESIDLEESQFSLNPGIWIDSCIVRSKSMGRDIEWVAEKAKDGVKRCFQHKDRMHVRNMNNRMNITEMKGTRNRKTKVDTGESEGVGFVSAWSLEVIVLQEEGFAWPNLLYNKILYIEYRWTDWHSGSVCMSRSGSSALHTGACSSRFRQQNSLFQLTEGLYIPGFGRLVSPRTPAAGPKAEHPRWELDPSYYFLMRPSCYFSCCTWNGQLRLGGISPILSPEHIHWPDNPLSSIHSSVEDWGSFGLSLRNYCLSSVVLSRSRTRLF